MPSGKKLSRNLEAFTFASLRWRITRSESLAVTHENMVARFWTTARSTERTLRLAPAPSTYCARRGSLAVRPWTLNGTNDSCLLYTSDAADDLLCVDLGGRRIIKKKKKK